MEIHKHHVRTANELHVKKREIMQGLATSQHSNDHHNVSIFNAKLEVLNWVLGL